MKEETLRKISKDIKSVIALITAITSVFSVVIVQLFKGGAYLQEKGYYDLWNIPSTYIEVNSANKLFQLLLVLSLTLISTSVALIYCDFFFKIVYSRGKKKLLKLILIVLLIPIFVSFLWICYLCVQVGVIAVFQFICQKPMCFMWRTSPFVIVAIIFLICIGVFYYPFIQDLLIIKRKEKPEEKKASAEAYKEKSISNRQSFIVYVILILMFAVITSWCGFTIYQQGRNDAAKEIVLDTVNMDDRTYVVLKKYNDNWILKECKFVDNGIRINKDAYFIADISGKKILRYSVKENQSLEEWMQPEQLI